MPKTKRGALFCLFFLLAFFCLVIFSQISANINSGRISDTHNNSHSAEVIIPLPPDTVIPITPTTILPNTPIPPTDIPIPLHSTVSDVASGLVSLQISTIGVNSVVEVASSVDSASGISFATPKENPMWIPPYWSADFGSTGLSIIYGHRQWGPTPKVFTALDRLVVGDQAIITSPQYQFTYIVTETNVINPSDLWNLAFNHDQLAKAGGKNELMLITCTPWGTDLQRLVIFLSLENVDAINP